MYSDSMTGNAYATVDLNLFANTGLQRVHGGGHKQMQGPQQHYC